jgi:hypothetical protein
MNSGRKYAPSPYIHGFDCGNTSNCVPLLPFPYGIFQYPPPLFSAVVLIAMEVYNKSDLTIYCYLICVLFWLCGCLCHVMICVPDPKMCIYTDDVCNQEVFWILFLHFVWQAKYETLCLCSWWEKYVTLNTMSADNTTFICNSVSPMQHFQPYFSWC